MKHFLLVMFFVFAGLSRQPTHAQVEVSCADAILKSLDWGKIISGHRLKMSTTVSVGVTNSTDNHGPETHKDSIQISDAIFDAKRGRYRIATIQGLSSLVIKNSSDVVNEKTDFGYLALGNQDEFFLRMLDGPNNVLQDDSPRSYFDGLQLTMMQNSIRLFPISLMNISETPDQTTIEMIDFIVENTNERNVQISEEKATDGRNARVFRVKRPFKAKSPGACCYRIVVSLDGLDNGLVTEVHEGYMKQEELAADYVSESQLKPRQIVSTYTKWMTFDSESSEKCIVPAHITKKKLIKDPGVSLLNKQTTEFTWEPLGDTDESEFSFERCSEVATELRKSVDEFLRR